MALLITDPVCFRRKPDGDLLFPLELARGLEAVSIGVRTRILMFAGEWFLDLLAGIKYLRSLDGTTVPERAALLGQRFDPVKAKSEYRREILATPGVLSVPTLLATFDGTQRRLGVTWVARTVFGDTPVETLSREV